MEEKKIPENINYDEIQSLRIEAKQKLNLYRPINIGQASRISGVSPADISVLLVYLGHKINDRYACLNYVLMQRSSKCFHAV